MTDLGAAIHTSWVALDDLLAIEYMMCKEVIVGITIDILEIVLVAADNTLLWAVWAAFPVLLGTILQ